MEIYRPTPPARGQLRALDASFTCTAISCPLLSLSLTYLLRAAITRPLDATSPRGHSRMSSKKRVSSVRTLVELVLISRPSLNYLCRTSELLGPGCPSPSSGTDTSSHRHSALAVFVVIWHLAPVDNL
ncbi:hypothetical protein PLICRDRAFT_228330 [Plicaturopsis crispa FD-325 SS-3]|nr:hypothetical protein PLICRDRAFT_228330 [Plicaturopsis crispa FD-325 SS-3]